MIDNLKKEIVIAPLAGITNEPFRIFLKNLGAKITFTEMLSSEGIIRYDKKSLNMMNIVKEPPLTIPQIFGANPEIIYEAAKIVINNGFKAVDINMGCPVKKVVKKGAGVKLMDTPAKIKNIIVKLRKLPVKISAKIRLGISKDKINFLEIINILYNEGIDFVTIHPRTGEEFFKNNAKWEYIAEAKIKFPKLFIVGNGDIKTPENIKEMFDLTNCDSIMIGRIACENPFIIQQWEQFKTNNNYTYFSIKDKISAFQTLFYLLSEFYNDKITLNLSKKYLILLTKGTYGSSAFRKKLTKIKNCIEILNEIRYWNDN